MLHILHVDTGRGWRGGQSQVLGLLATLAGTDDLRQSLSAPAGSPLADRAADLGVEVLTPPLRGEFDVSSSRTLRHWANENDVHIIHAHDAHAHAIALRAVHPRSPAKLVVHRRVDFPVRRGWLGRRKYGPRVDAYVAISGGVANVLADCGIPRDKIEIIPSGVDLHRFDDLSAAPSIREEFAIPAGAPLVGNVAALADHKGHRFLIEAMQEVIASVPDAHCVIVGEGELRDALERQIADSDLPPGRVILAGWRDDVGQCLRQFDLFCLSSHLEGLCTSLLDAAIMGLPLVAFDTGGVPDIVRDGETGWLAPVPDSSALARRVVEALQTPEEARRRAEAANRHVTENFDIEATAQKTLALWRRMVAEGGDHG